MNTGERCHCQPDSLISYHVFQHSLGLHILDSSMERERFSPEVINGSVERELSPEVNEARVHS